MTFTYRNADNGPFSEALDSSGDISFRTIYMRDCSLCQAVVMDSLFLATKKMHDPEGWADDLEICDTVLCLPCFDRIARVVAIAREKLAAEGVVR